jgi:hypothetical protein
MQIITPLEKGYADKPGHPDSYDMPISSGICIKMSV